MCDFRALAQCLVEGLNFIHIFSIIFLSMMSDKSTESNLDAWGKCLGILLLFCFFSVMAGCSSSVKLLCDSGASVNASDFVS